MATSSKNRYFISILAVSLLLGGCIGIRHAKPDERILYEQNIKAPAHISRETLKSYYAQRENRRLLKKLPIAPLVGIYYWGERRYKPEKYLAKKERLVKKFDTKIANAKSQKKINNYEFRKQKKLDRINRFIEDGNLGMQWGEPLAIFDTALLTQTKERFKGYLFTQGYFNAQVDANVDNVKEIFIKRYVEKLVKVDYVITPGQPYHIDSVLYSINDPAVYKFVRESMASSFIRKGDRYNEENFIRERERLDLLLRDNGFYDFSRQYIDYRVDSTSLSPTRKLIFQIIIKEPAKRGYHKQFTIDSVNFVTDAGVSVPGINRQRRRYRQIQYSYFEDNYNLKILSQRVFLQPGEHYSRSRTFNTQRQLANVDAFKFININYDTANGKFIANIFSSPLPRYEWSNEAGVSVTQGFPGPFYSISFRKRNIFKGLENFELNGRFGFEGVASATVEQNVYKSTEASINASLTFPQFVLPLKERARFKLAQYNPKTRFTTGYAFTDRPEYRRRSVSLNGTYSWQNNKNRAYLFTPFNVSVIDTANLSTSFRNLLLQQDTLGNFSLVNSFKPSFVTSMIFSVTWNHNNYGNIESNSGFTRIQLETGGTIWNFVDPSIVTNLNLVYYKYLRLSADLRRITVLSKTATLAYRLNGGFALPYGNNKSLPYEKFFFAGGSNSIRAWRPRRLGPGSFKPDLSLGDRPLTDGYFNYSIEKPADILIESSIELRKRLFGFVNGALFIDAGNTWTFEQRKSVSDDNLVIDNGNSQFRLNTFMKEIAVGTGFGLRFDFTFLILRVDVGIKAYDPAQEGSDRFVLHKARFWKPYATKLPDDTFTNLKEPVIYNVGIGYSF